MTVTSPSPAVATSDDTLLSILRCPPTQISLPLQVGTTLKQYQSFGWSDFDFGLSIDEASSCQDESWTGVHRSTKTLLPTTAQLPTHTSTTCSSTTINNEKKKKRISFSPSVEVRIFAITLGDHPCCSRNRMALTCDWQVQETQVVVLNEEREHVIRDKQQQRPQRRNLCKEQRLSRFRLSYHQRLMRLMECTGLSLCQLMQLQEEQQKAEELLNPCKPMIKSASAYSLRTMEATANTEQPLCSWKSHSAAASLHIPPTVKQSIIFW